MTAESTSDFIPKIDVDRCVGCELCVKVCPNQVWSMEGDLAAVTRPEACDYEGACQDVCPTQAITLTYEIVLIPKRSTSKSIGPNF